MHNKTILVTGGAGFIGSHLVRYLLKRYPHYYIINLDLLTYAGNLGRVNDVEDYANYKFIQGNICDIELIDQIFTNHDITGIFHLAAESHVDNSISNPQIFVETNIKGTLVLLEAARKNWQKSNDLCRFINVSTDEVYGSLGNYGYFDETTPYAPNSPYSASKASGDFLCRSYFHTFGLPVIISNCSNNYGPMQHDEKLIPTIIRNALSCKSIPIYGKGHNVRDWLYVLDHCSALDTIFHKGKLGESYNIGSCNEKTNNDIATLICQILDEIHPSSTGSYHEQITHIRDRLGHDFRYAINNEKIRNMLGWQPNHTFYNSLVDTVKYYIEYYNER